MKNKLFLSILLSTLYAGIINGQNLTVSASVSGLVSGSGLGSSVSPQVILGTEKHSLSAGINIQTRQGNFSGARARYSFVFNPTDVQELFLFYDMGYNNKAFLGRYTIIQENNLSSEATLYFDNAKLKTIEQHIGFGMNIYAAPSLKIFGAVGAGYYTTLNCKGQCLFQYREKNNFSLLLTAGVKLDIKKIY